MLGESNDLALHYNSFFLNMQTEFYTDLTLKIPHVILAKAEWENRLFQNLFSRKTPFFFVFIF